MPKPDLIDISGAAQLPAEALAEGYRFFTRPYNPREGGHFVAWLMHWEKTQYKTACPFHRMPTPEQAVKAIEMYKEIKGIKA